MVDIERLDAAITYAARNPERFDMTMWFGRTQCGTTACLAGTIAVQAGWTPVGWHRLNGRDNEYAVQVARDGVRDAVSAVAAQLLGLRPVHDHPVFTALFYANDLAAVVDVRNRLAREAGIPERTWSLP